MDAFERPGLSFSPEKVIEGFAEIFKIGRRKELLQEQKFCC